MTARRGVAVLTVAMAITGCSNGTTPPSATSGQRAGPITITALARALTAAGTARMVSKTTNLGPSWPEPRSENDGLTDFAHHQAVSTTRTWNRKGKVRVVTYRQIGHHIYAKGPSGPARLFRNTRGKAWTRITVPGGVPFGSPFLAGPAVSATDHRLRFIRMGTETVRGVATTHYRIHNTLRIPAKLRALGYTGGLNKVQVWVDQHGRARRIVTDGSFPDAKNHNHSVVEYFGFGVPVSVKPPAAHDVAIDDSYRVPVPTGSWKPVSHGTAGRISWTVSTVSVKDGWCFGLDTVPPIPLPGAKVAGRTTASCTQGASPLDEPLSLTLQLLPNGSQLWFGSTDPHATSVTLHYDDGQTEEITPANGGMAFSITGNRIVMKIVPHIPGDDWTCLLDPKFDFSYNCSGSSGGPTNIPGDSTPTTGPPGFDPNPGDPIASPPVAQP